MVHQKSHSYILLCAFLEKGRANFSYPSHVYAAAAAAAKSLESCPTLCDPVDGSPPGSPVHAILQARTLEWVAISFSNAWKWKVKVKSLSRAWLLATPWTAPYQAPPSMGFSRQVYWSGVPLPSPPHVYTTPLFNSRVLNQGITKRAVTKWAVISHIINVIGEW